MASSDNESISDDELEAIETSEDLDNELDALADAAEGAAHPHVHATRADNPARDDDGRLDTDLTCIQCEYNLRGQLPEGTCPECGAPVAESMRSDRLSQANPHWLRKLRRSTTWLMLGGFSVLLFSCFNGGSWAVFTGSGSLPRLIGLAVNFAQAALFCIGYWLLTEPEPGVLRPRLSRPITRWTMIPGYALSIPALLFEFAQDPVLIISYRVLQIVSGVAVFAGFCASLIYLRHLARRIPHTGLAKQTSIVIWGSLSTMLAVVPAVAILIIFGDDLAFGGQAELALFIVCPIALAVLTFFIWWLVLISVYSRSFDRAVKASRNRIRATRRSAAHPA